MSEFVASTVELFPEPVAETPVSVKSGADKAVTEPTIEEDVVVIESPESPVVVDVVDKSGTLATEEQDKAEEASEGDTEHGGPKTPVGSPPMISKGAASALVDDNDDEPPSKKAKEAQPYSENTGASSEKGGDEAE
uniref:Uncharacterized protein n=1 Tax=Caenorhabditis japonica TaxID=281687 RepID=A0A8R1I3T5_CAEJA